MITYVQGVPDHCDRIVWRGRYYHLPMCGGPQPEQDAGIAEEIAAIVSPAWIDPNDKAQARYLPSIGERVLFSYKGRVYYGAHMGGSFKSGSHHYNTWACRWMPLPAAPHL